MNNKKTIDVEVVMSEVFKLFAHLSELTNYGIITYEDQGDYIEVMTLLAKLSMLRNILKKGGAESESICIGNEFGRYNITNSSVDKR